MLMDLMFYMGFGILWIGPCVLIGVIQVNAHNQFAAILFLASVWPYLMYRVFYNVLSGNPNDGIWP